jgi:PKD repeat protein
VANRFKKKILAVEMVLILLISGFVGYVYISRQDVSGVGYENENLIQDTIKTTDQPLQSLQAHIKAGPLTGYGPLTVNFYGNPENDPNIVSYHWEFSPTTLPIIPQSQYKPVHFSIILFLIFNVFYGLLYTLLTIFRYKTSSQYESTEQNPIMIFPYTGTYSATLSITDKAGKTSSDIIWVTVLQYVYPNHSDND